MIAGEGALGIGVGLIGSGFMGRTHALAFANVNRVFALPIAADLVVLADLDASVAAKGAYALGFSRSTADWTRLVADPDVGIVAITTPTMLHKPMALAAIAAGKHVYCEKPLAPTAREALEMCLAAEKAGIETQVGFNYLKNPMMTLARDIIASGEIGEIRTFRGIHAEDFMADASAPWTWRLDPSGGGGALADLGSHIIAAARYLVGPIAAVLGDTATLIPQRPGPDRSVLQAVEVDDIARASLRFASGAVGSVEASWVASGFKMQHGFEVAGSKGGLVFSQERFNELRLYRADDQANQRGFRTIVAGPEHEPYGAFCVAGGHQIGFNDLKTIEVRDFLRAITQHATGHADFREGWEVAKVVEAIYASARSGGWVTV